MEASEAGVTESWTDELQVFCADIGSIPKDRFGWARRHPGGPGEEHLPGSIESLANAVVAQLERGNPVALGFEMPLFVPVPADPQRLGAARPTDVGAPAWSSSTGASVMATGIVQAAWVLRSIFERTPGTEAFARWEPFAAAKSGLMVWEAFVSAGAKGVSHEDDAKIGLEAFCGQLPDPGDPEAKQIESPISTVAAICMWAGWDLPASELRRPGVVIRAQPPT